MLRELWCRRYPPSFIFSKKWRFADAINREISVTQALFGWVSTLIKKGKEAIDLFDKGDRPDLSKKEQDEVDILKKYLPEQVSEADLRIRIQEVVKELGAHGQGDLGRVMKILVPEFRGRADNKLVKNLVGEYLGSWWRISSFHT